MGNLRIIGLGPTDASGLTAEAIAAIEDDSENFLRTEHHDAVEYFRSHAIPYTAMIIYTTPWRISIPSTAPLRRT